MEHLIHLAHKDNTRDLILAGILSLVLHALFYVILATTTIFLPLSGDAEKLDVLWLYPALLFGSRSEPVVQAIPETQQEQLQVAQAGPPLELPAAITTPSEKKKEIPPVAPPTPASTIPPLPHPPSAREITPEPRHSEAPEDVDTGGDQEMKYPAGPGTLQGAGESLDEKAVPTAVKSPPQPAETEKKAAKTTNEQPLPQSADAQPAEPPVVERETPKTFSKIVPPSPVADILQNADKIDQPLLTPLAQPQESVASDSRKGRTDATVPKPPPTPAGSVSEQRAATATPPQAAAPLASKADQQTIAKASPPASVAAPKEETKSQPIINLPPVKAILAAPIAGDLKLEISATPEVLKGVKITVLFREYPKNRHNRPQTKNEFGRVNVLVPKLARPGENILQAVIEIAGEGIYEFRAELGGKRPVEAGLAVKFFENSAQARVKTIADRKVLDNGSVAKILMPECILWDDDAYFSGNMEDSDSVTKFNSETGVVWKEYK